MRIIEKYWYLFTMLVSLLAIGISGEFILPSSYPVAMIVIVLSVFGVVLSACRMIAEIHWEE